MPNIDFHKMQSSRHCCTFANKRGRITWITRHGKHRGTEVREQEGSGPPNTFARARDEHRFAGE
ncbi:hypothetical protein GCM10011488_13870 [Steroidobacter agaridevorans]|nr:hypothetical protein GCM10011488_13870 [Steroidobacter agaridevorans]